MPDRDQRMHFALDALTAAEREVALRLLEDLVAMVCIRPAAKVRPALH